jgi:glycosyltransferase involved in cell wall biosynthesis
MKGAAGVIAPNEFMAGEIQRRYGVGATVIHNPCDLSQYEFGAADRETDGPEDAAGGGGRIVYTGAVSMASHADAFVRLLAAVESLGRPEVKLHLYSAQPASLLERHGIRGPLVHHAHHAASAMPDVQRRADVLFLPLALDSPYPVLIDTSCPSKMGEYMASGSPILAHVPATSFVAWYLKKYECGVVVDERDPAKLAEAVERLLADGALRREISRRARERAVDDFSVEIARATFTKLMGLDAHAPARAGAS